MKIPFASHGEHGDRDLSQSRKRIVNEEEADRRIIRLIDKVKGRNKKLEELRDSAKEASGADKKKSFTKLADG